MNQPLRDLWDRIDVGVPPVAQISAQGERIKRRRRLAIAAGAAAVVLVVAGGVSMRLLTDEPPNDVAASGVPAPPQGMRWVGVGRVVVAVPEWWSTGETQCLAPVEDTVYFDQAAQADCADAPSLAEVREVSALAVLDATSGYGENELRSMRSIGEVDGREILERPDCNDWFEGICRRLFAVPSEGVVFAVTIAESGDGNYAEIRDSLWILPAGMTTVPLVTSDGWTPTWGAPPDTADALAEKLKDAGLVVKTEVTDPSSTGDRAVLIADLPAGSYLGVSPELGSPIEVGGTVTITVMGHPDGQRN
jgi:hypothetical protein